MTTLGIILTIFLTLLLTLVTAFLLKAARQRDEAYATVAHLERLGQGLHAFIKEDVATGRTSFSFTMNTSAVRTFEVWRNDRIDAAKRLVRMWEKRYIEDPETIPSSRGLTPDDVNAIGREAMEYQPSAHLRARDWDPKEGT